MVFDVGDTSDRGTVTFTDDDDPPSVTLAVDNATISESGGVATLTASLSTRSDLDVTVDLAFAGTAVLEDDFTRSTTQIVIPAGQLNGTATITAVSDSVIEGNETVLVDIDQVLNATESTVQQVTVTISDMTPVLDIELVAVAAPSANNSTSPPAPLESITVGGTYYVEVWLQEFDPRYSGTVGGQVDVTYDTSVSDAVALVHTGFSVLSSGTIDDAAGRVDDFGGAALTPGLGEAPAWARLGYLEMTATAIGMQTFTLEAGALAFGLTAGGNIPWQNVDLSDVASLEIVVATQWDLSVVRAPTATEANGEVAEVPASVSDLHEWEAYYVELWGHTSNAADNIAAAQFALDYETALTTAVEVSSGPSFTLEAHAINDAAGLLDATLTAHADDLGDDRPVLLARVRFEPREDDQAVVDEVNHVAGPYELGISLAAGQATVGGFTSAAGIGTPPAPALWAVPYDIDDNNAIDFDDFSHFTPAFGRITGGDEPPFVVWADFDGSGLVDFGDFSYFVANFNKSRIDTELIFPPGSPLYVPSSDGEGEDSGAAGQPGPDAAPGFSIFDTETGRLLMNALHAEGPYQNGRIALDVDNDGGIYPADVLRLFNVLNGGRPTTVFLDVNGDHSVTALDALIVINALHRQTEGEGEGLGQDALSELAILSAVVPTPVPVSAKIAPSFVKMSHADTTTRRATDNAPLPLAAANATRVDDDPPSIQRMPCLEPADGDDLDSAIADFAADILDIWRRSHS